MIISEPNYATLSPYVIPGLKFELMPYLDQENKAQSILIKVSNFFKVPVKNILSGRREGEYLAARFWAMWFIRCNTNLSLKAIGRIMGNKHHSTIIHGIKAIKDQLSLKHDNETKDQYQLLIQII